MDRRENPHIKLLVPPGVLPSKLLVIQRFYTTSLVVGSNNRATHWAKLVGQNKYHWYLVENN